MINIAIFVSGNGTNCENIIRHFNGKSEVNVCIVVSNKTDAYALTRAASLGVDNVYLSRKDINDSNVILPIMRKHRVDFIVLAGFLQMIPDFLINEFPNRIINLHPALLPKFGGKGMYGNHVHEAVKASGDKETGITIHYVNNVYDGGQIIEQHKITLSQRDAVDDIEQKVHMLEQRYFPLAIERLITKI